MGNEPKEAVFMVRMILVLLAIQTGALIGLVLKLVLQ